MTLNTVGFDGTVSESQWSRLMRYTSEIAYRHGVASGLDVTVGTGTGRPFNISAGTALLPGVLADSLSTVTLSVDPNAGSATRTDYVVLRADWTANTVVPAVVKGTSTTPPALTETEGSLWEMPLARIAVRPSVTTLLSTDITICKPLPRATRIIYKPGIAAFSQSPNHAQSVVGTANVVDPGWPYQVRVTGAVSFNTAASGFGRLIAQVGSTVIDRGETALLAPSRSTARVNEVSGVLNGPQTVTANVVAFGMGSGDGPLANSDQTGLNSFTVEVIPV